MISSLTHEKSDALGAVASGLCLIHCIATPFLFAVQSCAISGCTGAPIWWTAVDFLFLCISFFAVYQSVRTTFKDWIKYALWIAWIALALVIVGERVGAVHLSGPVIFIPALSLIGLHVYNRQYCQCEEDSCCAAN